MERIRTCKQDAAKSWPARALREFQLCLHVLLKRTTSVTETAFEQAENEVDVGTI